MSIRQTATSLGIPVMTVSNQLRRARQAGLGWPLPEGMSDGELEARLFARPPSPPSELRPLPEWNYVHKELRRPGVTLMLLWMEYKEAHPGDGYGYSQFCLRYRAWQRHVDVVMRQEHRAGEKLFVDFPGQHLAIYDRRTGQVATYAELFVAVLGASNYLYAEAVASQDLSSWITAHVHAFEAMGCVPRIVVPENVPRNIFRVMCPSRLCALPRWSPAAMGVNGRTAVVPGT
jgi:transposase